MKIPVILHRPYTLAYKLEVSRDSTVEWVDRPDGAVALCIDGMLYELLPPAEHLGPHVFRHARIALAALNDVREGIRLACEAEQVVDCLRAPWVYTLDGIRRTVFIELVRQHWLTVLSGPSTPLDSAELERAFAQALATGRRPSFEQADCLTSQIGRWVVWDALIVAYPEPEKLEVIARAAVLGAAVHWAIAGADRCYSRRELVLADQPAAQHPAAERWDSACNYLEVARYHFDQGSYAHAVDAARWAQWALGVLAQ